MWLDVDDDPRAATATAAAALEQAASIGCGCCQPSGVRDDDAAEVPFEVEVEVNGCANNSCRRHVSHVNTQIHAAAAHTHQVIGQLTALARRLGRLGL